MGVGDDDAVDLPKRCVAGALSSQFRGERSGIIPFSA